jgi:hypothetical protein
VRGLGEVPVLHVLRDALAERVVAGRVLADLARDDVAGGRDVHQHDDAPADAGGDVQRVLVALVHVGDLTLHDVLDDLGGEPIGRRVGGRGGDDVLVELEVVLGRLVRGRALVRDHGRGALASGVPRATAARGLASARTVAPGTSGARRRRCDCRDRRHQPSIRSTHPDLRPRHRYPLGWRGVNAGASPRPRGRDARARRSAAAPPGGSRGLPGRARSRPPSRRRS